MLRSIWRSGGRCDVPISLLFVASPTGGIDRMTAPCEIPLQAKLASRRTTSVPIKVRRITAKA